MNATTACLFHVTAQFPEGGYKADVKASNPITALTKVINRLGLNEMPAGAFLITVTPKRK